MRCINVALAAVIALGLAGCAGTAKQVKPETDVEQRYQLALNALEQRNDQKAEALLKAFVQTHSDYAGPYANLGLVYERMGKQEQAKAAYDQAMKLGPKSADIYHAAGLYYRRAGRFQEAESAYLKALEIDPDYGPARRNLAILYDVYLKQPEQALRHYREYLARNGGDKQIEMWVEGVERQLALAAAAVD